jgi:hypothetical protein
LTARIDWSAVADLGEVPDRVIAERLGCTQSAVSVARRRAGVPAWDTSRAPKRIAWDEQPLGRVADLELARRLGCAATTVGAARKLRGIPAFVPPPTAPTARSERAAIVAYLRQLPGFHDPFDGSMVRIAAEAIEHGAHLAGGTP